MRHTKKRNAGLSLILVLGALILSVQGAWAATPATAGVSSSAAAWATSYGEHLDEEALHEADGAVWPIVVRAAVGAGVGAVGSAATYLVENAFSEDFDWGDLAQSTAVGAASGAVSGPVVNQWISAVTGAVAGGLASRLSSDD